MLSICGSGVASATVSRGRGDAHRRPGPFWAGAGRLESTAGGAGGCCRRQLRPGQVVHRDLPDGRAAATFDLGSQARGAGRNSRRVCADRHERARHQHFRAVVPHGPARRQAGHPARDVHRGQRPFVERLRHADRPAAFTARGRERQSWPAEQLADVGGRGATLARPAAICPPRSACRIRFSTPTSRSGPARTAVFWERPTTLAVALPAGVRSDERGAARFAGRYFRARLENRRSLLVQLDGLRRAADQASKVRAFSDRQGRAFNLLSLPAGASGI